MNSGTQQRARAKGGREVLAEANEALERRVAERTAELQSTLARLNENLSSSRALAETASDAFIMADEGGAIIEWNPAAERMFGYTRAEALGQALTLIMPERYRDDHSIGLKRVLADGERHVIGKTVELHGLTKANVEFPLELSLSTWKTRKGRIFGAIIRDITRRKQAGLALARQKDLYAMLSQTNQAIVRASGDQELFDEVCRIAVEHGRFVLAWIGLLGKDQRLEAVARCGANAGYAEYANQLRISMNESDPWGRGIIGKALRSGSYGFNNEILDDTVAYPWQAAARRVGVRALASFPLRRNGTVIGAVSVYSNEPGFFTEALVATLNEMATDVSFALDNFEREAKRKRAEHELIESEERFRSLTAMSSDFYWQSDAEHRLMARGPDSRPAVVPAFANDAQVGLHRWEIPHVAPDEAGWQAHRAVLDAHQAFRNFEFSLLGAGGSVRHVLVSGDPLFDAAGAFRGYRGVGTDITARKQSETKIRRLNLLYAALSGINTLIVRVRDREELFHEACRITVEKGGFLMAWIGIPDWDAMQVTPVSWHGIEDCYIRAMPLGLDPAQSGRYGVVGRAVVERKTMTVDDIAKDKLLLLQDLARAHGFKSLAVLPIQFAGDVVAVIALYASEIEFFDEQGMNLLHELTGDIAFALDHIEKASRLDYLAYYDPLTGLANRTLFVDRLKQYAHAASLAGDQLALVLIDLDRFRRVNESLGRGAGDELLRQFAGRLVQVTDAGELARISADLFAIVQLALTGKSEVTRRIERLWQVCFSEPFRLTDSDQRVSAKAGVALFPGDSSDIETLFFSAEAALDKAKKTGERHVFHSSELTENTSAQLTYENQLRQALEKDEFVLHYQPKVDVDTRRIVGVEALIRWQSLTLGLVSPGRFIPLLEETGLIVEVGAWALSRAVADHSRWLSQGIAAPRVAVNISAIQLRRQDFVASLEEVLKGGAAPPGIDLEITESLVMEDIQGNIEKLKTMRDLGVRIAIDDFGTGYSSLGYLARLPVQALKIDRSFVITMLEDPDAMTLVSTIISLAHSLRLKVIAEGVETEEQAKMLRLLRCDEMQGYLFSRPVPFEQMTTLLTQAAQGSGLALSHLPQYKT